MLGALFMLYGIAITALVVVLMDARARRVERDKHSDSTARQRSV